MKSGLLCVEMVIIVFLGNIEVDFPDDLPSSCSRDKSRLVRTIIDKKILPIFERYRLEMPIECPFHPHRDLLWWPEDNLSAYIFNGILDPSNKNNNIKSKSTFSIVSITETLASFFTSIWRCPLCFKLFDCSERLAHHWDYDHRLYRHRTENFVCLSDYCDFIRCDILTRRRIYPTIGTSKYLARMISSTLAINPSNLPPNLPPAPSLSDLSGPQHCNQTEMVILERRCKITVRQCLLPLIINKITVKDFHDIEDDLVKEACGYLNCEKFFDITITEESARPLSFCVLMGIFMIGGFLICYYFVWYLFESTIGLKRAQLEQLKRTAQVKLNRPQSCLPLAASPITFTSTASSTSTITTINKKPSEIQTNRLQRQLNLDHNSSASNHDKNWPNYRYAVSSYSPLSHLGESETSQEDVSPGSSESRYIVTHPPGSHHRRYQRASQLYLASELALLLEKRSMETVPESSDDQGTPRISYGSEMVSCSSPPGPPPPSLAQSTYHRPSSADTNSRSSSRSKFTHANNTRSSQPAEGSATSQGSQDSRQDSCRSTVSMQHRNSIVSSPNQSPPDQNYYPNRRRNFALKGRCQSRYEGDDYNTFDDDDELITTITTTTSSTVRPQQPVEPTTIIGIRKSLSSGHRSDDEVRRRLYEQTDHNNRVMSDSTATGPHEYRSSRGILFSTRHHDKKHCEFNFDDDRRSTGQKSSSSRSTNETKSGNTRIKGRSELGGFKFDRGSPSGSVASTCPEIESEPLMMTIPSGRSFYRPAMKRSISSIGATRRAAMASQRSQESSTSVPTPSTSTTTGPNQSNRYSRLTKSQSMDNPVYPKSKQLTRSTHR